MAGLKPEEISAVIREKIENYPVRLEAAQTGMVVQTADGIARIYGLDQVMTGSTDWIR